MVLFPDSPAPEIREEMTGKDTELIFEYGVLLMYTLEGLSSVANFITAYEESVKPRLPFSNPQCVLCFQRQSF